MQLDSLDVVATAAVREAENGAEFLDRVRALGLPARLLDGEEEARAAGYGVISGLPQADGVVADLGGGSLELVRIGEGEVRQSASFPLGAMRIAALRPRDGGRLQRQVAEAIARLGKRGDICGTPLYLVGGSFRTLVRVHMHLARHPLPIIGNYAFAPAEANRLRRSLAASDAKALAALPGVKASRVPQLNDASALLCELVRALEPSEVVASAFGLREGLLYQGLAAEDRGRDPLIEGVRFLTDSQQQVAGYAEALDGWLGQLFDDETRDLARLRLAVCLLRGTGWTSNPDFRALGGEELALHGNWIGVTAADRAAMAMALFVGMGGDGQRAPPILSQLADRALLDRARARGLGIRLAQRIGGGAPALLQATQLQREGDALIVALPAGQGALIDGTLERRAGRLAHALGLSGATILA
jgi:exopolyphosphatase/guanosine-5'-triphosphate,3'-diphosphate pyrophosphatase